MTGNVLKIQKYSIHDGPGIRTSVFLKGCPLSCWWCHNPESIRPGRNLIFFEEKCLGCGRCGKACPPQAITLETGKPEINREACTLCGSCADVCPGGALELIGREMTVDEVMAAVAKDLVFYEESGGGVTFTGGEPTFQFEFLLELLEACKSKGIHTAIDTSGFVPWEKLERLARLTDLFLFDLKLMDEEKHKKYTGVSNGLILENLRKLSAVHRGIHVRMPIITGINDDRENITEACRFLSELRLHKVSVLPYHTIGINKYDRFGMTYKLRDTKPPEEAAIAEIVKMLTQAGFEVS